jgi:hypothetical protein
VNSTKTKHAIFLDGYKLGSAVPFAVVNVLAYIGGHELNLRFHTHFPKEDEGAQWPLDALVLVFRQENSTFSGIGSPCRLK